MRSTTLILVLLGAATSPAQNPSFIVAAPKAGFVPYGDGRQSLTQSGPLQTPFLAIYDRAQEDLILRFRLPAYSHLASVTPDRSLFVIHRVVDGASRAEVRDENNRLVTFEAMENRDDKLHLPAPVVSPDKSTLFFYVPRQPGLQSPNFYDYTTYYRPLRGGPLKVAQGRLVQLAPGIGGFKTPGSNRSEFVAIPSGQPVSLPLRLASNERPLGGDGTWAVSTLNILNHVRISRLSDGSSRHFKLGAGDLYLGLAEEGKALFYCHGLGKIVRVDLAQGSEAFIADWRQPGHSAADRLVPALSPDRKHLTLPLTSGQGTLIDLDGTVLTTLYSREGQAVGFSSGGRPFITFNDGTLTERGPTGEIERSVFVGTPDLRPKISQDGRFAITRNGTQVMRRDLANDSQPAKWFSASPFDSILYSPDARYALQIPLEEGPLLWRNDQGGSKTVALKGSDVRGVMPNGHILWTEYVHPYTYLRQTDPLTGKISHSLPVGQGLVVTDVSLTASGHRAVVLGDGVRFVDFEARTVRKITNFPTGRAAISPAGDLVAFSLDDHIQVRKTSTGALVRSVPVRGTLTAPFYFSPDGKDLFVLWEGNASLHPVVLSGA